MPFRALAGRADRRHAALPDHWEVIEEADGASVPAGDLAGARLPQLELQRDADLAGERRPPDGDDPSRTTRNGRHRRRRQRSCSAIRAARCGLHARLFEGVRRGVLIAESIWPNAAYDDGRGINTLTGADAIAPFGGAAFHDNKVWIRPAAA